MFAETFNKLKSFEEHHQVLFAVIVVFGVVCFSWGVERILEKYLFPNKPVYGYLLAVVGGLALLWLSKFVVLHVL